MYSKLHKQSNARGMQGVIAIVHYQNGYLSAGLLSHSLHKYFMQTSSIPAAGTNLTRQFAAAGGEVHLT